MGSTFFLRISPGREAYPGEIFFVHSRLLERSALVGEQLGGGSVTAFPVIETLGGDVSAYITTNVISITDGQIFLSVDLFLSGICPSVDVGLSVTRVGSAAQWDGMKLVGSAYKLELAQYMELQAFSQFSSDLGDETKARLARGIRLVEILKQNNGSPQNLPSQVCLLSIANQDLISTLQESLLSTYERIRRRASKLGVFVCSSQGFRVFHHIIATLGTQAIFVKLVTSVVSWSLEFVISSGFGPF